MNTTEPWRDGGGWGEGKGRGTAHLGAQPLPTASVKPSFPPCPPRSCKWGWGCVGAARIGSQEPTRCISSQFHTQGPDIEDLKLASDSICTTETGQPESLFVTHLLAHQRVGTLFREAPMLGEVTSHAT